VEVDWIVVASSSAGTQAGLVLGAIQAGWNGRILGISIDHKASVLQDMGLNWQWRRQTAM
jgi:1-aminocyclopropane-1-carboxylate deaminase/D-cysteine desulfhydrase-like pyridoxal-dependent ACC family enzyme